MSQTIVRRAMMAGLGVAAATLAAAGLAATASAVPDPTPPFPFDPITSYPGGLYGGSDVNDFYIANAGGTTYTEYQFTSDFYVSSNGTPHFDFTPTIVTTDGEVPGTMATGFYDDNDFQTFIGNTIAQYNTVSGLNDYVTDDNVDHFFFGLPTTTELSDTVTPPPPDSGESLLEPSFWDASGLSALLGDLSSLYSDLTSLF